ncbi:MAG: orotidine-5'-phosphate decarboxylase [Myxococcaceae bacterium]
MTAPRDRIALAADIPLDQALSLYPSVAPHVGYVKVGLSLFVEHGPRAVKEFLSRGARVFLDLKLHDIPNTVQLAAEKAGALGVSLLTVHAQGGEAMLKAAVAGANEGAAKASVAPPRILAVTVLTSMSDADLMATGHNAGTADTAKWLAELCVKSGVTGLVCSPLEVEALRKRFGDALFLCTPGVRPAGSAKGDQTRVETPAAAIKSGSSLLVVGRPIYSAPDPVTVAKAIADEVASAG